MTAPPRLFSLPYDGPVLEDTGAVSLLKDAAELEPTVIEATPVDDPAPPAAGWMADRQARLDEAPRIVPAWLRDRALLGDNARFVARWYGHVWGYHGLRAPVYATRLWIRAPRGTVRLGARWTHWVTDAEARPVGAKAAASDPQTWMQFVTVQSRRTGPRRRMSIVVAVPAVLLVTLAYVLLPGWAALVAAAGVLSLLGVAGRDADRPIVHRYVHVQMQRRLDSGEVEMALEAIKVTGRIDWANPIATDGPGWLAELDLPPGVLADTVVAMRPALAAAMRRPLACVWPETDRDAHPGRLKLWVARQDPAKAKRRLWPLMQAGQADLFKPIPFGFDPRGRLVELELIGTNMLIGGVMGSGKTSAVLAIVLAAMLDPSAELHLYELKGSGDLACAEPVSRMYVSGDDDEHCEAALNGLRWLEKEMKRRKDIIQGLPLTDVPEGRKVYPHLAARRDLGLHPILAVFDEAHTLFEHEDHGPPAKKVGADLIRKARAYGIVILFTTQRPDKDSIPKKISDNAILRFCLAVSGQQSNDMVLGTSMYKRGIRATIFDPQHDAGTGYLARSAVSAQIVRAAFIKQEEAQAIAQRAYALRVAAGTLLRDPIEQVDESTVVDHLREIWPAGEDTMHSATLVEALAAHRPAEYEAWMQQDTAGRSTTLAGALRPYGIRTQQINKRKAGGGAKGLRWEDLQHAGSGSDEDL